MKNTNIGFEFEFKSKNIKSLEKEVFSLVSPKGYIFNYGNYSEPTISNYKDWLLTVDGQNYELISPILKLDDALEFLNSILDILSQFAYTDDHCGLHINISHDKIDEINIIKFLLLIKSNNLDNTWKKNRNHCVRDIYITLNKTKPEIFIQNAHQLKYYNISIRKNHSDSKNFVEYRVMGGENYQLSKGKILKEMTLILECYLTSCDNSKGEDTFKELYNELLSKNDGKETISLNELDKLAQEKDLDISELLSRKKENGYIINHE